MMIRLQYGLILGIIYPLACLPQRVLFLFADIFYGITYYLLQYRKSVVYTNLSRSFPEKSYKEIKRLVRQYYRYLADVFFENICVLGTSGKKMKRRISFENHELLENYGREGKSVVLMLGHYGNWEYFATLFLFYNYDFKIAYKEQKGASDLLMKKIRRHFRKDQIIPMQHLLKYMLTHKDEQHFYVFIADQSPSGHSKCWTTFLHQDTLFFNGAEKAAVHLDLPVVYMEILRKKRGHYHYTFTPICEHSKALPEHTITVKFAELLEDSINRHPQYWLWSHKRWKHRRNINNQ